MFNDGIRTDANEKEINKNIAAIFFKNERVAREKHDLSTTAMAEFLGCHQASFSNWENGRYVPKDLDNIIKKTAELFDLDPQVLLSEDFADRYDPDAYEKNSPEEKPKNLTPVIEINGKHYVNQHETDKDIAIRYLTSLMEEQKKKSDEMWTAFRTAQEAFESYKNSLILLGVNVEDDTDGTD